MTTGTTKKPVNILAFFIRSGEIADLAIEAESIRQAGCGKALKSRPGTVSATKAVRSSCGRSYLMTSSRCFVDWLKFLGFRRQAEELFCDCRGEARCMVALTQRGSRRN
jgi:hypothetical protein